MHNLNTFIATGLPKFPNLFEITSNSQWNKRGSVYTAGTVSSLFLVHSIFRTYVFSASSPEERADWIEALQVGCCCCHVVTLRHYWIITATQL